MLISPNVILFSAISAILLIGLASGADEKGKQPVYGSLSTVRAIGQFRLRRCCQLGLCPCPNQWPYQRIGQQFAWPGQWSSYRGANYVPYVQQGGFQYDQINPFGYGPPQQQPSSGGQWDDEEDGDYAASSSGQRVRLGHQGVEVSDDKPQVIELSQSDEDDGEGSSDSSTSTASSRPVRSADMVDSSRKARPRRQGRLVSNRQKMKEKRRGNQNAHASAGNHANNRNGGGNGQSGDANNNRDNNRDQMKNPRTVRTTMQPRSTKMPRRVNARKDG